MEVVVALLAEKCQLARPSQGSCLVCMLPQREEAYEYTARRSSSAVVDRVDALCCVLTRKWPAARGGVAVPRQETDVWLS